MYDSHNDFLANVDQSDVKDLFHLPNSTVGKSVRAVISPSEDDTNSLDHQCDTGDEKDCHVCQTFYNENINVDVR